MNHDSKQTILICDDEEGVRESLKLVLSDSFKVNSVSNGLAAIEYLKKSSADAMFLDIKMPKVSGMDILKQIKKLKPAMPVIIVTGYQSVEMAQEAIKNGASDYIAKPFEPKQILSSLARALKQ